MHHAAPPPTREREGGRDNRGGLHCGGRRVGRGAAPHPPDLLRPPGASVSATVARRRWDTTTSQRRSEAGYRNT
jgi:hypothetical protein